MLQEPNLAEKVITNLQFRSLSSEKEPSVTYVKHNKKGKMKKKEKR